MENYANQAVEYMYVDYPLVYAVRSSLLQGYYYNEATAVTYFATEYYTTSI